LVDAEETEEAIPWQFGDVRQGDVCEGVLWRVRGGGFAMDVDDGHAGAFGGGDSCDGVFEDDAASWGDAEFFRGEEEGLGVGFSGGDLIAADADGEEVEEAGGEEEALDFR
jgi:hypothetical protein